MALCYKDRTFCEAASRCVNAVGCFRHLDTIEKTRANSWAISMGMVGEDGSPEPWIAWSDFSSRCESYSPKVEVKA